MAVASAESTAGGLGFAVPHVAGIQLRGLRSARSPVLLYCFVGLLVGVHRAEQHLSDTDVLWGARSGIGFLQTGRLPRSDTYTWIVAGRSWIPNSWGWNLVLALVYRTAGVAGFTLLTVAMSVALAVAIGHASHRVGATPGWTGILLAAAGPLVIVVSPRAQTAAMLCMLAIPPLLRTALRDTPRKAAYAAIVIWVLQALWMNVHSSAMLEPLLLVAGGLALVAQSERGRRLRSTGRLAVVTVGAGVGCLATPYGTAPLRHLSAVERSSSGVMQEWDHAGLAGLWPVVGLITAAAALLAATLAWRSGRSDTAAILILLALGTADAIRFIPLAIAFAIPELAAAGSRLNVRPHMQGRILAAGCGVLVALTVSSARTLASLGAPLASPGLVARIPHNCRLVNDMLVGGAVILLRPDVKVSLDSRNDMYGRASVVSALSLLANAPGTQQRLSDARVGCVLAYPGYPLVAALQQDLGWRTVASDGVRTLVVRQVAP